MADDNDYIRHSKQTSHLIGHKQAEKEFLNLFDSDRLPSSWLITGARGIGKATLAYRIARFLLSGDSGKSENLFGDDERGIRIDEEHPVFKRVVHGSHSDLLTLEVNKEENKKEILVDDVRELEHFFGHTASESKWRVAIIDSVDEMNRNAANALLKTLEEPPDNTALLLVSHAPGSLLPTITSRCRFLKLKPLSYDEVIEVIKENITDIDMKEAEFAANLSNGSPGIALDIYKKGGHVLYESLIKTLSTMPDINFSSAYEMGEKLAKERSDWHVATYMLGFFLAKAVEEGILKERFSEFVSGEATLKEHILNEHSIDHLADLWEKICHIAVESERVNMDIKSSAIQLFGSFQN